MPLEYFRGLKESKNIEELDLCINAPLQPTNSIDEIYEEQSVIMEQVTAKDVKTKVTAVIDQLKDRLISSIDSDPSGYMKSIKIFEKQLQKLPSSDSALQKTLCSFGKEATQVFSILL